MNIRKTSKSKAIKARKIHTVADKAAMIREATRLTLEQYSKTFADLARYDRTEKSHSLSR